MSDEPRPEDEVQDEPAAEPKSGKKSKAEKKKAAAAASAQVEAEAAAPEEQPADSPPADQPAAASGAAQDLFQQGVQALLHADYDGADNFFGQALNTYRKQGDKAGQIDVLEQLGHVCFLRGAEAQAREYYQQAGLMRAG